MTTVNEQIRDELVGHLVDLHRYSNTVAARILAILRQSDAQLSARLTDALVHMDATQFTVQRLGELLAGVRDANRQAYDQAMQAMTQEMSSFVKYELDHQKLAFEKELPDSLIVGTPSIGQVYAAATATPFQGRLLSEWFADLSAAKALRIESTIRMGFVTGKTVDEMIREVRGTRAENFKDGILAIDTRNAEAVVRTAISHVASVARNEFYKENSDIIKAEQWVSTLDNRTTEICQIRDGLLYTVDDHEPIDHDVPWEEDPGAIHWNCRSVSVPVIESAKALGLDLPPGERAAMGGTVPASTTYGEWFAKQPAARQDDILGPTRGALFRQGGLKFDQFFSNKGVYLNLDELKQRDAAAFRKAGV